MIKFYKDGVITAKSGCSTNNNTNHAVVVVGYSTEPFGQDDYVVEKWWFKKASKATKDAGKDFKHGYYKIQNSWGTDWGKDGFVYFEITDGYTGVCGMRSLRYSDLADLDD